jgi:hypothetical protein
MLEGEAQQLQGDVEGVDLCGFFSQLQYSMIFCHKNNYKGWQ